MKKLFLIIIISIASISVVRSQDFKYEIGAGAGGDEAALFAAELFRM